ALRHFHRTACSCAKNAAKFEKQEKEEESMSKRTISKEAFNDIAESMGLVGDGVDVYFDLETSQTIPVTEMDIETIDELSDDSADSQNEMAVSVKQILENVDGRYLKLPDSFEINQWNVMKNFAEAQTDEDYASDLQSAIHGSGAFKKFKKILMQHDLETEWYQFRNETFRTMALEWCETNGLTLSE
ncbi:MAG: UPF0158 family protein, partial [Candidatus Obscuribacterales bacterium]|nr:UPF0158 family protein [Candidatus Obscuribacterales bacterium]